MLYQFIPQEGGSGVVEEKTPQGSRSIPISSGGKKREKGRKSLLRRVAKRGKEGTPNRHADPHRAVHRGGKKKRKPGCTDLFAKRGGGKDKMPPAPARKFPPERHPTVLQKKGEKKGGHFPPIFSGKGGERKKREPTSRAVF